MKHINFIDFSSRNFLRQNVSIPPDQNISILFTSNIYWEYLKILGQKLCMKIWYNSNFFPNCFGFPCLILWVQNVLIPPDQNLSIPLDQNVPILLISNI